jgi:hypothetical protein
MKFRVGQIIAQCPKCGGTEFKIPLEEHSGPLMRYQCAGCGAGTEYAKLVKQIGRQVMEKRSVRLSGERANNVRSGVS